MRFFQRSSRAPPATEADVAKENGKQDAESHEAQWQLYSPYDDADGPLAPIICA
jgi:hypothetical protein